MITIICPVYNEEKYINNCIDSILNCDYPKDSMELIFVDGRSTDRTLEILNGYEEKYKFIKVLDNPKRIAPCAMNIGIQSAKGDIIIRIDAHAQYPKDYISTLSSKLIELKADNVGGICKTEVINKTKKSKAICEILRHKIGVGNSDFRTGVKTMKEVDTVPFGCYRKEIFNNVGMYNEFLARNQDIELNKRIKHHGGKIFLIPEVECTYYARETWSAIAKNNFQNGLWNILTVWYTKDFNSLSLRHFIPLLFILSILIPFIISIFWSYAAYIGAISISCYLFTIGLVSIKTAISKKINVFLLIWSFCVLHFSYGFGSLLGIIKLTFIKTQLQ